jgi:pimeloyl-ACP methyl ester carboxylesterase
MRPADRAQSAHFEELSMTEACEPRSVYVDAAGFEIHATTWGPTDQPGLIMWHGLARSGRDFDDVARALADRFHVVCPDTIGRGLSAWSPAPERDYCFEAYTRIAEALANSLGFESLSWLGTSMGGSLAMRLAAGPMKGRIERLIINDIGPTLPVPAIERIKSYAGNPPEFDTLTALEAYFREIYVPFGPHTDAQWRHMAETSYRRLPSGKVTTHYDPAIVRQFFEHPKDYEIWTQWDAIEAPVLLVHGADSDLLLPEIISEMQVRQPSLEVTHIDGCGHAPALNTPDQIEIVRQFLVP